jgi:putative transposase
VCPNFTLSHFEHPYSKVEILLTYPKKEALSTSIKEEIALYTCRKCNEKDIFDKTEKGTIMLLAQKIRIFPNPAQERVLWDLSEKCRLLYNFGLQERIDNWRENKVKLKTEQQYITYLDQQNKLPLLKNKFQEYKWVYSKVLQMCLRKLDSDYKSFFAKWENGDKAARPPKYKGKKYFTTLCYNQMGFIIKQNYITFSHNHPSKIPLIFRLKYHFHGTSKIKQVDIKRESQLVCLYYI